MSDRSLDDLFPPGKVGPGYSCSSCGEPAPPPYTGENTIDSPLRDDPNIHPDKKMIRLLCDKCLAIEKLRRA